MKMKKVKPNLRAMFNFHTIILVILVVVLSTLHTHTIEGKLQTNHKHHHQHHTQNYKQHNVVDGGIDTDVENVADKLEQQPGHHNHQHSHHQHQHHQHHHQPHQPQYTATPSLEFTTSSSASLSSSAFMDSDNEFLIKQQQQLPLTNKDEIYYKTKDLKSSSSTSSTTSKPSLSIQLMKQHVGNMKTSSSNTTTTTMQSETLSNSRQEHTHLKHFNSNRLISTPSTKQQASSSGGGGGIDNNSSDTIATMYSDRNENSKLNLATTKDNDDTKLNEPAKHQNQSHNEHHHHHRDQDHEHDQKTKPEFHHEQPAHQNYEDYYSDAEDDDDDDDYNEDEGDNDNIDGISYDDDNNLSDRSYARITRSKLDDDYIDDEPYRNGPNDLSKQHDAPGVLTEQKYLDVGNEKAVQQARERYIQEQKRPRTPQELATEHWHRMIQATKCRKPLPRVIPVSNNTSKRYEPYATILHRCGDDTGCCGSTASVCTVKRHEIVMVYVFSYDFNYRKEIEALPMQNHTECHCVNRGSLLHDSMPRDKRSGGSGAGGGLGTTSYLHHFQRQQRKQQHRQSQQQFQQLQSHHQQQLQNMLDCHCPRHFNVFEEDVERHAHLPKPHSVFIRKCRCDCLVNNQTCLRFKHGEEGFSLEDRKCILERNCKPPVCSYGEYNLRVGRCPSYYRSHLLQTT